MRNPKSVVAVMIACAITATPAMAGPGPIKDGSGAAKIVDKSFTTLASPIGENPIL
ncbi:hypothetical protein [Streptomyces spectabilis]|uniref:hypothetical protein n=1 Tax=Streptomyces spectabilis TaxID=68270 RepID=UPI0013768A03|nr:hypothetical protein [Streptomyces spectabilis]